jgi:tRNA pseudouridine38-40 synthase
MILNRALPEDLRVLKAEEVGPDFNARFCAEWRRYIYRIALEQTDPFLLRVAYGYWTDLNLDSMRAAASNLVGEHDFVAYTEELDPEIENTVRELHSVEITQPGRVVEIEIIGNAFLRGMMRRISGCLFEIGRGARPVQDAADLLTESRDGMQWPVVLPAKGLTLEEVRYGNPPVDHR